MVAWSTPASASRGEDVPTEASASEKSAGMVMTKSTSDAVSYTHLTLPTN